MKDRFGGETCNLPSNYNPNVSWFVQHLYSSILTISFFIFLNKDKE